MVKVAYNALSTISNSVCVTHLSSLSLSLSLRYYLQQQLTLRHPPLHKLMSLQRQLVAMVLL
jgi:hypothetical protein